MNVAGEDLEALQKAEQDCYRARRQGIGLPEAHQAVVAWIDAAMAVDAQLFAVDKANRTGCRDPRDNPNSSGGLLGVRYVWNGRKHPKSEGDVVEIVASPFGNLAAPRPQTVARAPLPPHAGTVGQEIRWVPFDRLAKQKPPKGGDAELRAEQGRHVYKVYLEGRSIPETVHAMSDFLHHEATKP